LSDQETEVIIYTDGGASGNPGPGGYGTVLLYGPHKKELSAGYRLTTNNRMELMAVIIGLEALKKPGLLVVVVSDSKYVVDAVQKGWVFTWERNRFKKKKNPDLWVRFLKIYRQHHVRFHWVKGHNGTLYNELADKLAVSAYQKGNLLVDEGYESGLADGEDGSLF
jgi:ribonuclease HI